MNFLEKFKGKTNVITKRGINGLTNNNYDIQSRKKVGEIVLPTMFRKSQTNSHQFEQKLKQQPKIFTQKSKEKQEDSFFQNMEFKSNNMFPLIKLRSKPSEKQVLKRNSNKQLFGGKIRGQSGFCLSLLQEKYKDILDQFIIVQNNKKNKKFNI